MANTVPFIGQGDPSIPYDLRRVIWAMIAEYHQTDPLSLGMVLSWPALNPFTSATAWGAANDARYVRVLGSGTITKLRIHVGTAAGNVSLGVYSSVGDGLAAVPTIRKATTGAIACPTAGIADVSLGASVNVQTGDFFAMSCSDNTAEFLQHSGIGDTSLAAGRSYKEASAHPLPVTPSPGTGHNFRVPLIVGVP